MRNTALMMLILVSACTAKTQRADEMDAESDAALDSSQELDSEFPPDDCVRFVVQGAILERDYGLDIQIRESAYDLVITGNQTAQEGTFPFHESPTLSPFRVYLTIKEGNRVYYATQGAFIVEDWDEPTGALTAAVYATEMVEMELVEGYWSIVTGGDTICLDYLEFAASQPPEAVPSAICEDFEGAPYGLATTVSEDLQTGQVSFQARDVSETLTFTVTTTLASGNYDLVYRAAPGQLEILHSMNTIQMKAVSGRVALNLSLGSVTLEDVVFLEHTSSTQAQPGGWTTCYDRVTLAAQD